MIKDKIRKLLNLAANNPNEAEAASAIDKASRLMLENGLLEGDLISDDDSQKVVDIRKVYSVKMNNWHGALAHGVSQMNLCDVYTRSIYVDRSKTSYRTKYIKESGLCFVGTEGRVETSHQMLDYLITAIERLADKDLRFAKKWQNPYPENSKGKWVQWKNSYKYAAARRLRNRMLELAKARETQGMETSDGQHINALTVQTAAEQSRAAIENYLATLQLRKGKQSSGPSSQSGYEAGLAGADQVSLNTQVGSTSNALCLN